MPVIGIGVIKPFSYSCCLWIGVDIPQSIQHAPVVCWSNGSGVIPSESSRACGLLEQWKGDRFVIPNTYSTRLSGNGSCCLWSVTSLPKNARNDQKGDSKPWLNTSQSNASALAIPLHHQDAEANEGD